MEQKGFRIEGKEAKGEGEWAKDGDKLVNRRAR